MFCSRGLEIGRHSVERDFETPNEADNGNRDYNSEFFGSRNDRSLQTTTWNNLKFLRASSNSEIIMTILCSTLPKLSSKGNQSSDQIRIYSTRLRSLPFQLISLQKNSFSKEQNPPSFSSVSLPKHEITSDSAGIRIFSPCPRFESIAKHCAARLIRLRSLATIIPVLHDRSIIPRFHSPPCLRTGSKESAANGSIRGNTRIRINRHSNKCSAIRAAPQSVPQTGIWQRRRSFSTHRNRLPPPRPPLLCLRRTPPSFIPFVSLASAKPPMSRCYTGVYEES